ncbi:hypothetical protein ACWD3J_41510, partial [Streptomyces sp. NPDC002755]|uniref:hypothetical protein n=1 Tax=Streptomyces sp. NPDC002884 TaxID=3154544 RepID=UPI003327B909
MTPPTVRTIPREPLTPLRRLPAAYLTTTGSRLAGPAPLPAPTPAHQQPASPPTHSPLAPGAAVRVLIGVVVAGAVVIAGIGFAGSYAAVRELAL